MFNVVDSDGSGFLSKRDLKSLLIDMGENPNDEDIDEMFKEADKDGDGKVSFEEFKEIYKSLGVYISDHSEVCLPTRVSIIFILQAYDR